MSRPRAVKRRLRSRRCLRDEVNGAADERPAGKRQGQRGQAAGRGGRAARQRVAGGRAARPVRPRIAALPRRSRVPPRRRSRALPGRRRRRRSRPTSAARLHRPSHCAAEPARPPPSAAPQTSASGAPGSRNRLRHRQPRADAGAAGCAAASSDDGQHGDNRKGRSASWRGCENQPAGGATEKPREAAANRRSSPSRRGECGRAAQPQGDQLARRRKRCGLAENRHRAGLRGVPARIPQQRSRERVAWAGAKPPKRL